jgi:2-polyprenyl-3-methyl-5-hydroxy-6-metoxy-1,4-benzoquinol methylase
VDYSQSAVELAKRSAQNNAVSNADFIVDDATQLNMVEPAAFDAVTAIDFVEHINDQELGSFLKAVQQKMRPEGRLCIYTPSASHYVERLRGIGLIKQLRGHIAVRTFEQLRVLFLQQGWVIKEYFFLPSTYPLFGWIDNMLHTKPLLGRWFCFRICFVAVSAKGLS